MKRLLLMLSALAFTPSSFADTTNYRIIMKFSTAMAPSAPAWTPPVGEFALHPNGVTITCVGVDPGDQGEVNGRTYTAITNQDLLDWRAANYHRHGTANPSLYENACTSLVTNMAFAFNQGTISPEIGHWDTSQVTAFNSMFSRGGIEQHFNSDIRHWNMSSAQNLNYMFSGALFFNYPIGNWDLSSALTMEAMFQNAEAFDQDISAWNVSNVTTMHMMFRNAVVFNQDISGWNTSNVQYMNNMFERAYKFNQDLSCWNVLNVVNNDWFANQAFDYVLPKPVWGTAGC